MPNSLFSSMKVAASGMAAQRARMDVISQNIANAESTRTSAGGPYRRRLVVFQTSPEQARFDNLLVRKSEQAQGVRVKQVIEDKSPFREVNDPGHPNADANGMVRYPNVNPVQEMVDLTAAGRGFEANVTTLEASKRMFLKTLDLLR